MENHYRSKLERAQANLHVNAQQRDQTIGGNSKPSSKNNAIEFYGSTSRNRKDSSESEDGMDNTRRSAYQRQNPYTTISNAQLSENQKTEFQFLKSQSSTVSQVPSALDFDKMLEKIEQNQKATKNDLGVLKSKQRKLKVINQSSHSSQLSSKESESRNRKSGALGSLSQLILKNNITSSISSSIKSGLSHLSSFKTSELKRKFGDVSSRVSLEKMSSDRLKNEMKSPARKLESEKYANQKNTSQNLITSSKSFMNEGLSQISSMKSSSMASSLTINSSFHQRDSEASFITKGNKKKQTPQRKKQEGGGYMNFPFITTFTHHQKDESADQTKSVSKKTSAEQSSMGTALKELERTNLDQPVSDVSSSNDDGGEIKSATTPYNQSDTFVDSESAATSNSSLFPSLGRSLSKNQQPADQIALIQKKSLFAKERTRSFKIEKSPSIVKSQQSEVFRKALNNSAEKRRFSILKNITSRRFQQKHVQISEQQKRGSKSAPRLSEGNLLKDPSSNQDYEALALQLRKQSTTREHLRQIEEKEKKFHEFKMKRLSFSRQYTSIVKEIHKKTMEPGVQVNQSSLRRSITKQSSLYGDDDRIPLRIDGKIKYKDQIEELRKINKRLNLVRAVLAILVVLLLQLNLEILISNNNQYNYQTFSLKAVATGLTVIEFIVMFMLARNKVKLHKFINDKAHIPVKIYRIKYFFWFLSDVFLHCLINPPGMQVTFRLYQRGMLCIYSWDMICSCICLFRLHIILELIPQFSIYTQPQAKRLCNQNGAKAQMTFAWKALMKKYPYFVLGSAIMISVLFFGTILRNLERANVERNGMYDNAWDAFWVIMIMMLTIGYGDVTIETNPGRILGIFAALWGQVIYSMFILSMTVWTKQDDHDKRAYKRFVQEDGMAKLKKTSAYIIANFIMHNHLNKKRENLISITKRYKEIKVENSSSYGFASSSLNVGQELPNTPSYQAPKINVAHPLTQPLPDYKYLKFYSHSFTNNISSPLPDKLPSSEQRNHLEPKNVRLKALGVSPPLRKASPPQRQLSSSNGMLGFLYQKRKSIIIEEEDEDDVKTQKQINDISTTKYLFNMVRAIQIFNKQRMVYMHQDENIDSLLVSMEFHLQMSQNEQQLLSHKFDACSDLIEDIMEENDKRKYMTQKSKTLSFQLNNFARMMVEFGSRLSMKNLNKLESEKFMSLEEMNKFIATYQEKNQRQSESHSSGGQKLSFLEEEIHSLDPKKQESEALSVKIDLRVGRDERLEKLREKINSFNCSPINHSFQKRNDVLIEEELLLDSDSDNTPLARKRKNRITHQNSLRSGLNSSLSSNMDNLIQLTKFQSSTAAVPGSIQRPRQNPSIAFQNRRKQSTLSSRLRGRSTPAVNNNLWIHNFNQRNMSHLKVNSALQNAQLRRKSYQMSQFQRQQQLYTPPIQQKLPSQNDNLQQQQPTHIVPIVMQPQRSQTIFDTGSGRQRFSLMDAPIEEMMFEDSSESISGNVDQAKSSSSDSSFHKKSRFSPKKARQKKPQKQSLAKERKNSSNSVSSNSDSETSSIKKMRIKKRLL